MQTSNKKIIIVDDNAANLSVGRNLLKSFYEVYPAPSAAKMFEILERVIPELILLDVNMPEMNGYEAIKILKADPRFAEIPIIFLTANSDEESEMEGFDSGAADYVTKPFFGPLLLRRIANQLLIFQQKKDLQDYAENLEFKVREKTAAKTIFLASMSHEMRTPMNSIIGFSELALDEDISSAAQDYLGKILENSQWLLHIINDILDISNIETDQLKLDISTFKLYEIISGFRKLFMSKANEKGLTFNINANPTLSSALKGDPARLRQALINLISNAIKFTVSGTVDFQMDVREVNENRVDVYFEVKDTGIGMTSDQTAIIFDPFIQVQSGTTRNYGGTGLGLTITKKIIDLMGGNIVVESTPDVGSKFSFLLSFEMVTSGAGDKDNENTFDDSKKPVFAGEVLLCEDSILNQQVASDNLTKVGIKTVIAENGKKGVELVESKVGEKQFDLIFMDIHMPVMDGVEAAEKIAKIDPNIPIVAMTANIMPDDVESYIKAGMKECLGKPFVSKDLLRCLLRYLKPVSWETAEDTE